MCVCVLDHFLIVTKCHVQVINADPNLLAFSVAVATESLGDN